MDMNGYETAMTIYINGIEDSIDELNKRLAYYDDLRKTIQEDKSIDIYELESKLSKNEKYGIVGDKIEKLGKRLYFG